MRIRANISGDIMEAPWYVFLIDAAGCHVCDWVPPIPFPSIKMRDEDGELTTWREYWGDFRQWWHCVIHDPLLQWADARIQKAK